MHGGAQSGLERWWTSDRTKPITELPIASLLFERTALTHLLALRLRAWCWDPHRDCERAREQEPLWIADVKRTRKAWHTAVDRLNALRRALSSAVLNADPTGALVLPVVLCALVAEYVLFPSPSNWVAPAYR